MVHRRRDHGGLIFIDLRDRTGLLQVVIDPQEAGAEIFAAAERLRSEHVISVRGTVASRGAEHVNPNLPTGEIELRTAALNVLADAATPPFPVDEETPVSEEIRLKYRAIDLRREGLREALILRSKLVNAMRSHLNDNGSWRSRRPRSRAPRPRARATSSCRAATSRAASTHCRRARSSSSSC